MAHHAAAVAKPGKCTFIPKIRVISVSGEQDHA